MDRYSHRLPWSFSPNPLSRLIEQKKKAGVPILDLTVSNPTEVLPRYPHREMSAALSNLRSLHYFPQTFGITQARSELSLYYRERGWNVATSRIALTASTSEAYGILFKLLCDPGDEVLVPSPSYPLFQYLASLENVRPVSYPLRYDGSWYLDPPELCRRISRRSRAIIVVNPNNPTGSFLKRSEMHELVAIALERNLVLISDEVFMDYDFEVVHSRLRSLAGEDRVLSFSLSGLSKLAAMPQMKLAWILINGPAVEIEAAQARLELILDTYLSVNTPVQVALPALLRIGSALRTELFSRAKSNLQIANTIFQDSPIHVLQTEGGWSMLLQLPRTQTEEEWVQCLLRDHDVLLQPGYFFDMASEAFCVASLITEQPVFQEGLLRLNRLVLSES